MSNKPRNDMQKARRAYLAKCKKEGIKPISTELFAEGWKKAQMDAAKKVEKAVKKELKKAPAKKAKEVKKANKSARAKVHEIRRGDVLKFVDFDICAIVDLVHNIFSDVARCFNEGK